MEFTDQVKEKLAQLPDQPGVYLMRDRQGRIIYVGKAASLRKRVQSYFRRSTFRSAEPKLRGLIKSVQDLDFLALRTEAEATLTESRLIKDYRPRYNILLRDDKRFLLLRVNLQEPFPRFDAVRLRKEDGALYWGPYASSQSAWAALEFIEKRFGLRQCRPREPGPEDHRHCLNDIVRFCAAPCIGKVTPEQYRLRVREACDFLEGKRNDVLANLKAEMEAEAKALHFEKAAALRDTYLLLRKAVKERAQVRKTPGMKNEEAMAGLLELQQALGLPALPRRMEAYDISNISGTLAVGSRVCARDGMAHPADYRLYRIRTVQGSDDPAMMAEVIRRRFERALAENEPLPDLVIVDGGVTQLGAARQEMDRLGLTQLRAIGLAKQFEELHTGPAPADKPLRLPENSPALQILKRIRDEAHRFALTYHLRLRKRRIQESILDDIPGVGERKKLMLLKHFGSIQRLKKAPEAALAQLPFIGPKLAHDIAQALNGA